MDMMQKLELLIPETAEKKVMYTGSQDDLRPSVYFLRTYRIEHPHSAIVHRSADTEKEDVLYTPSGRLTRRMTRDEDGTFHQSAAFVRKASHLMLLASYADDMTVAALPAEPAEKGRCEICTLMPSPVVRLRREWLEPAAADRLMKEREAHRIRKCLDLLYGEEVSALSAHSPKIILMEEALDAASAADPQWRTWASKAAARVRALCPDAVLGVSAAFDLKFSAKALPFDAILFQDGSSADADAVNAWLQNPPAGAILLLPTE